MTTTPTDTPPEGAALDLEHYAEAKAWLQKRWNQECPNTAHVRQLADYAAHLAARQQAEPQESRAGGAPEVVARALYVWDHSESAARRDWDSGITSREAYLSKARAVVAALTAPDPTAALTEQLEETKRHLAEAEARAAWRPIEGAPKDRTTVLVWDGQYVVVADLEDDQWWTIYTDIDAEVYDPTHWMPLPEPPRVLSGSDSTPGTEGGANV